MWSYNTSYLSHEANYKYIDKYMGKNGKMIYVYEDSSSKGERKRRPSLNAEGKQAAKQVKEEITAEKDAALTEEQERHEAEREIIRDATKRTMEQHRKIMNERITSIQNLIKRMPPMQKKAQLPKLKYTIEKLREDNDKKRASIQEKYQKENYESSLVTKSNKQQIREAARQSYQDELDRISSNSKYKK